MTSELRPAMEVWWKADTAFGAACLKDGRGDYAAAAVIEADREAVRAEQASELAKYKALAETLAGALDDVISATCAYLPPDGISKGECINMVIAATDNMEVMEALRKWEESRDAS
ncbi:hypothetical protein [Pseudomonas sp.]|uniref:hypothetical protein n=1 Tax=Pseudomonas sp. TaxID=306 RepID=UPI002583DF83|nr:hypothetical protein [Pseudomonas sp.]